MIKKDNNKEDLLRQYLNPEGIEKAPDGFTSKVMTHIHLEPIPLKSNRIFQNIGLVPILSAVITLTLIAAALSMPGSESGTLALPVVNLIENINFSLPEINLTYISGLELPPLLYYVIAGLMILTLSDRALAVFFFRGKQSKVES